jgi:hypothetical protein
MRLFNTITAKIFVWLAAVLVPAETLPVVACNCGNHTPREMGVRSARAEAAPAAKCPHCTSKTRPQHSSGGAVAASSAQRGSCCGAKGSCCCKGGLGSHGGPCQCAQKKSAPAPDPLPSDSRTNNTKSSVTASACGGMAVVAVLVPTAIAAHAEQQSAFHGSSAPERLSILCRLVL